jgi:hypothetical protein
MNWSLFPTMDRLIGKTLFTHTGTEAHPQRAAYMKVFSNGKDNATAFASVAKIASAHVDLLTNGAGSVKLYDIKHATDNFAIALWGDYLYSNPVYYLHERVLPVYEHIVDT